MEKRFDLVGIGSMVVDLIYCTPRIIGSEEKIALLKHETGEIIRKLVGGVVLNNLSWASLLGLRVGICGKQGDDEYGRFLREGMDRYHIDKHLTLDGSSSSSAHIFVDPKGARSIYMSPAATLETNGEYVRTRHAHYIRSSRILSTEISQLPLDAVTAAMEIAHEAKVATVLDVDIPRGDAIKCLGSEADFERALKFAVYLKPSKAVVLEITGESDALRAAMILRDRYGSRAVVITDGENGCALSSEQLDCRIPAYRLNAIDTTGAGDAFLGGMIAGLHYGLKWPDVLKLANACGAACCEIMGATPDLPKSRARVLELYDGAPFNPLEFNRPAKAPHAPAS
jgi:sugar/nucleoside kinase (ribokinase family)